MIRKCPVLLNNDHVTVVRFDDIDIQFPAMGAITEYVNVLFEDGKYTVVEDIKVVDKIEEIEKPQPKSKRKKTTKQENVETVVDANV